MRDEIDQIKAEERAFELRSLRAVSRNYKPAPVSVIPPIPTASTAPDPDSQLTDELRKQLEAKDSQIANLVTEKKELEEEKKGVEEENKEINKEKVNISQEILIK